MPKALVADWPLIQTLYVQGKTAKEVALQTGVSHAAIIARASRGDWRRLAAASKQAMSTGLVEDKAATVSERKLEAQSSLVRSRLASILTRYSDLIEQSPPTTAKGAKIGAVELEPLVRSAKTVFAWGEALAQPAIRIQVVAQCRLASDLEPKPSLVPGSVPALGEKHALLGPALVQAEGGQASSGPGSVLEVSPHHFSTFEKPTLDVEVVKSEADSDYCI